MAGNTVYLERQFKINIEGGDDKIDSDDRKSLILNNNILLIN